ncbi:hypothetical protein WLQ65_05845 [Pseudoalteromonas piscicida]|uniref:hypothetical protein n=1 Tax=Pseudoalteromonas piscicida TaxID=43662 RepID=UPI0030C90DBC
MKKLKRNVRTLSRGIAQVVAAGNGSGNDPIPQAKSENDSITQAQAQIGMNYSDVYIIKVSNP